MEMDQEPEDAAFDLHLQALDIQFNEMHMQDPALLAELTALITADEGDHKAEHESDDKEEQLALQKELDLIISGGTIDCTVDTNDLTDSPIPEPEPEAAATPSTTLKSPQIIPETPLDAQGFNNSELVARMQMLLAEYRAAALVLKKQGDMHGARARMAVIKNMRGALEVVQVTGGLPPGYVIPVDVCDIPPIVPPTSSVIENNVPKDEPNESPQITAQSLTVKPAMKISLAQKSATYTKEQRDMTLISPEKALAVFTTQCDTCMSQIRFLFASNQKPRAVSWHKRRKQSTAAKYFAESAGVSISVEQVRVVVDRVIEMLNVAEFTIQLEISVECANPTSRIYTVEMPGLLSETRMVLTNQTWILDVLVSPGLRAGLKRLLERRKLKIVQHQLQSSWLGLVNTLVPVAKCLMSLDGLVGRVQVSQSLDMRALGGLRGKQEKEVCTFQARVRRPVGGGQDIQQDEIDWFELAPSQPTNSNAAPVETSIDLDTAELEFNNAEYIPSNGVLEHLVATLGTAEDAEQFKQQCEFQMNMLITQIQLGKLDVPMYAARLRVYLVKLREQEAAFSGAGKSILKDMAVKRRMLVEEELGQIA